MTRSPWTPARRARVYLALAVGWSWAFWSATIAIGRPFGDPVSVGLFAIGGAGVPLAAFLLLWAVDDRAARRDYLRRLVDLRRIGWLGWTVILLLPPALALGGALVYAIHGGSWPAFTPLREHLAAPMSLLPFLVFVMLFGPLPEELGWRGYALGPLQQAHGPLLAALVLGTVHAAWHLPMFFMEGSHQHGLGFLGPPFWRYMLATLFLSVVISWLFNRTAGSTLAAVMIHYTNNLTGELLRLPEPAEWLRLALLAGTAAVLLGVTRGKLAYGGRSEA